MPEGSKSKMENQAQESQRGVYDRNMLLLIPDVVYSTGSVIEHWQMDSRIPETEKQELANRRVVQSFLARFMKSRTESALKNLSSGDDLAQKLEKATEPVATLEYGGKKNGMKLYLGAQFSFFAALYLGETPTVTIDELLDLIAKNNGTVTPFSHALLDQHLQTPADKRQAEAKQTEEKASETAEQQQFTEEKATQQPVSTSPNRPVTDGIPSAPPNSDLSKHSLKASRWALGTSLYRGAAASFVKIALVVGICVGVLGGSLYLKFKPEEETLTEKHNQAGPAALKPYADLSRKAETKTELYGRLLALKNDPKIEFLQIAQQASPLLEDKNPGWIAKGQHALGLASFKRGNLENALSYFLSAETNLLGITHQRNDLRAVYLEIARCHYYLNDAGSMHDYIKKATLVDSDYFKGRIQYLYSRYWLLVGDLDKSIKHGDNSIRLALVEENKYHLAHFSANQSMLLTAAGQIKQSYRHLKVAQGVSKGLGDKLLDEYIISYEIFWAERLGLPVSGIHFTKVGNGFNATKNYISSDLELALKVRQPIRRELSEN